MSLVPDRTLQLLTEAYARAVPRRIRSVVTRIRNAVTVKRITRYYRDTELDSEMRDALSYLPFTDFLNFPYPWTKDIRQREAFMDADSGLPYVVLNGKRCYFLRGMPLRDVSINATCINDLEQHAESPHLYLTPEFDVEHGDVVADCGAGDGNFGLSVVDRVKKLYLFEPDEKWQEPLRQTFKPWADRVEIIKKYVSDTESEDSVTLDGFFKDKEGPTFLKVDVEGYERVALMGASEILCSSVKKAVVCTYHLADDLVTLSEIMSAKHFSVDPSNGYLLITSDGRRPDLRRGLIRCTKTEGFA